MYLNTSNNNFDKKNKNHFYLSGKNIFSDLASNKKVDINLEKFDDEIKNCFLVTIKLLKNSLNKIHNTNYPLGFWLILIGPWLLKFIDYTYYRFSEIENLKNLKLKLWTYVSDDYYTLEKFSDFYDLEQTDELNFFIYSSIIINTNNEINKKYIDSKKLIKNLNLKKNIKNNKIFSIKSFLKYCYEYIKLKIVIKKYKLLNINLSLSKKDLETLFKKLKTPLHSYNLVYSKKFNNSNLKINKNNRKSYKLSIKNNSSDFIKLLNNIIFCYMPKEYLEDFNINNEKAHKILDNNYLEQIYVRSTYETKTHIRFILAQLKSQGKKIISTQEGGGLGVKSYNHNDLFFSSLLCDFYLTWGLTSRSFKNIIPTVCTKTFYHLNQKKNKDKILLIGGSFRKYHFSLYEGNPVSHNKTNILFIDNFLKLLPSAVKNISTFRLHNNYNYLEGDYLSQKHPTIKFSKRESNDNFYNLLEKAKITICFSDYTANLQCLYFNIPVLFLWDKNTNSIRNDEKIYYKYLHDAGILFYDHKKCIDKLKSILKNPTSWWKSQEVQDARKFFIKRYINNDIDGLNKIIDFSQKMSQSIKITK